jgi:2-octaprenyl-3-methyl-6-methoxy-1,4-benzoquinol hydroxylase/2-octaprenylphenol hydroxylase
VSVRRPLDAVVAGGGMAGAAAALALAQAGFAVALLDRQRPPAWSPTAPADLRVVALAPSSAQLLDRLGVWSAIAAARVSPYRAMRVWDAASGAEFGFDAALLDRNELGWIVESNLVQASLWEALAAAGVECRAPVAVGAPVQESGRVRIPLDDGSALTARLLIAADGRDSPLRAAAGIVSRGRDYGQRAVVAHLDVERPHGNAAWQRFLPGGPLALLPLADGRVSLVWSLPDAEATAVLALGDADFCAAAGVGSDFRLGRVLATSARAAFALRLGVAQSFAATRLVLLGDAAHAVHPLAGQGINLGLRDVAELVAVLSAARDAGADIGADSVLRRYARRRRSADTIDAHAFDAIARAFAIDAVPWAAMRGFGMRTLDRLPALKRLLAAHAAGPAASR